MTDETLANDGPAPRPSGGGFAATVAPEGVAAILAIVVVLALLLGRLASAGGTAVATPSPTPTPVATARPAPGVDTGAIRQLQGVNEVLAEQRVAIGLELAAKQVDPSKLQPIFRLILAQLTNTGDLAAQQLTDSHGGAAVGNEITAIYLRLRDQASNASDYSPNDLSAKNLAKWRLSAVTIAKTLDELPPIDAKLELLLVSGGEPSPSSEPSAGASASAIASPSAATSPTAAPSPTPIPVTPPPATPVPTATPTNTASASPSPEPNLIVDGSFETGVGTPWQLQVSDPVALATVTPDTTNPHSPKVSARIDIQASSDREIGIAYKQTGFAVQAGAFYNVSIALRSTGFRDVRVRIADSDSGQILDSKIFTIGPAWSVQTYPFTTFVSSDAAVFSVDVGRSDLSVWVDDVSVSRIPPG